jgi:hypothetical protein
MNEKFEGLVEHLLDGSIFLEEAIEVLERRMIQRAMERTDGNQSELANSSASIVMPSKGSALSMALDAARRVRRAKRFRAMAAIVGSKLGLHKWDRPLLLLLLSLRSPVIAKQSLEYCYRKILRGRALVLRHSVVVRRRTADLETFTRLTIFSNSSLSYHPRFRRIA